MPRSPSKSFRKLWVLVLAPVILLAAIAVIGLGRQWAAIEEDARREMSHWVSEDRVSRLLSALEHEASDRPAVLFFAEVPASQFERTPGERRLEEALSDEDVEALRLLRGSQDSTAAGLPVAVLAAWRVYERTDAEEDRVQLLQLAVHERPSTISELIVERVAREEWSREWSVSQERRKFLAQAQAQSGFLVSPDGPYYRNSDRVLTPAELRRLLVEFAAADVQPTWMEVDYMVAGQSLFGDVSQPMVEVGGELRMVAGVSDENVLYERFWASIWWVLAIIACALLTALVGMWQIRRALLRERRLHELKSQFVASVSHELRTPVASMRLMADVLHAGKVGEEKAREFHELMSQEGARLTAMIENVLDFSRIEDGRKRYHLEPTDLASLVQDVVRLMEPLARERQVLLVSEEEVLPSDPPLDEGAMQQVLVNLLDNAIKFSPGGGSVKVSVGAWDDGWRIVVSDQGPGIPLEKRELVFERFVRLEDELRRESKGAGIGLAVVKHAVEAHGGIVEVRENADGGAEFVVAVGKAHRESMKQPATEEAPEVTPKPLAEGGS